MVSSNAEVSDSSILVFVVTAKSTQPNVIKCSSDVTLCTEKREVIASLRLQTWRMKEANDEIRAEVDLMQKEVYR